MGWKNYWIKLKCKNCEAVSKINVPKGISIAEFAESDHCRCNYCGCKIKPPFEYSTKWVK